MANVYKISVKGATYNIAGLIPTAVATSASATQFIGSFPGITGYVDGVAVFLRNNTVNSAANCTLQINNLGYKPIYLSRNTSTRLSTEWTVGTTGLFIYDSALNNNDGGWIFYAGLGSEDTDVYVQQNAGTLTTDANFPVILGAAASTAATVSYVNKSASLTYNPSTGALSATKFIGDGTSITNISASKVTLELTGDVNGSVTDNNSIITTLKTSGVTSGTYGYNSNTSLYSNATFIVPTFKVDEKGRIVWAQSQQLTMPNISTPPQYSSNTPVMDGVGSAGSNNAYYAAANHQHPSDTTRLAVAGGTMTGTLTCKNGTDYTTKQARNVYIMATGSSPTGGDNGDIALFY